MTRMIEVVEAKFCCSMCGELLYEDEAVLGAEGEYLCLHCLSDVEPETVRRWDQETTFPFLSDFLRSEGRIA